MTAPALRVFRVEDAPLPVPVHDQDGPLSYDRIPQLAEDNASARGRHLLTIISRLCWRADTRSIRATTADLAAESQTSTATVDRALAELKRDGWIHSQPVRGCREITLNYDLAGRRNTGAPSISSDRVTLSVLIDRSISSDRPPPIKENLEKKRKEASSSALELESNFTRESTPPPATTTTLLASLPKTEIESKPKAPETSRPGPGPQGPPGDDDDGSSRVPPEAKGPELGAVHRVVIKAQALWGPTVGFKVVKLAETFPPDWIDQALDKCRQVQAKAKDGKVGWPYLLTVLRSWRDEGGPPPPPAARARPVAAPVIDSKAAAAAHEAQQAADYADYQASIAGLTDPEEIAQATARAVQRAKDRRKKP